MNRFYDEDTSVKPLSDFQLIQLGIRPKKLFIHYRSFQKSYKEKAKLKRLKNKHRALLRSCGYDPNKRLNLNDPQVIKFAVS